MSNCLNRDNRERDKLKKDMLSAPALAREFYLDNTLDVAKRIIGHILLNETSEGVIAGRVVETEAYLTGDPASHGTYGMTKRNRITFGPPGYAYVYRIHAYYVMAAICQPEGISEVVHIRALEPLAGIELMMRNRKTGDIHNLCSGPGKLTQALDIDSKLYGADLTSSELRIVRGEEITDIVETTRIGIRLGREEPWRFYSRGHVGWVSRV